MECGLAYLIERELGRDGSAYAARIRRLCARPQMQKPGLVTRFGYEGLLYD